MRAMKRIGIIAALELEAQLLHSKLKSTQEHIQAGFRFVSGTLGDAEIVLVVCGVGKVNAAACTQLLIDRHQVDCIINTGVAGSICETLSPLDIVISSEVTHHDVQPAQLGNLFPFTRFFSGNADLIHLAQEACASLDLPGKYVLGRIVSGETFIEDDSQRNWIREQFAALCVEMEGAAVGHVAHLNSIPFVIIRTISDAADSGATESFHKFKTKAADTSAALVCAMIHHIQIN